MLFSWPGLCSRLRPFPIIIAARGCRPLFRSCFCTFPCALRPPWALFLPPRLSLMREVAGLACRRERYSHTTAQPPLPLSRISSFLAPANHFAGSPHFPSRGCRPFNRSYFRAFPCALRPLFRSYYVRFHVPRSLPLSRHSERERGISLRPVGLACTTWRRPSTAFPSMHEILRSALRPLSE